MEEDEPNRRTFLEKAGRAIKYIGLGGLLSTVVYLGYCKSDKKVGLDSSEEQKGISEDYKISNRKSENEDEDIQERNLRIYKSDLEKKVKEADTRLKAVKNPILVRNFRELQGIGTITGPVDGNYVLAGDIDCNGEIFRQIGNVIHEEIYPYTEIYPEVNSPFPRDLFSGTLNGNGYSIKNLLIESQEGDYQSFFGGTSPNSIIANLIIENMKFTGKSPRFSFTSFNSGILAGCLMETGSGDLQNLIYVNSGVVVDCRTLFKEAHRHHDSGSGFIQFNRGFVSGCSSRGKLFSSNSAGLVSCNRAMGVISDSVSSVDLDSIGSAGGICCENNGLIVNSLSIGKINSRLKGGVVASNNKGYIISCYENPNVPLGKESNPICPQSFNGKIRDVKPARDISNSTQMHYWARIQSPEVLERIRKRGFSLNP